MSLSREEFWVLDVAAQINCPVDIFFLDAPKADEIFNQRRHHGLSTNDLADLLVFMQRQGDLVLFPYRVNQFPECDIEDNSPFKAPGLRIIPDYTVIWKDATLYPKKAIIERLAEEKRIYGNNDEYSKFLQERLGVMLLLCLTPQGAEKWEQMAQVDWNKFLECSGRCDWEDTDLSEQQSLMIWRAAALQKETLDAYFDWKTRWDNTPYSWETSSFRRYQTERISPWRATYWKTFPEGFECDFLELILYREEGLTCEEHAIAMQQSAGRWPEHHAKFDWCNAYVRDFPFEDN